MPFAVGRLPEIASRRAGAIHLFRQAKYPYQQVDGMVSDLDQRASARERLIAVPSEGVTPVIEVMGLGQEDLFKAMLPSGGGPISSGASSLGSHNKLEISPLHKSHHLSAFREAAGKRQPLPHVNAPPRADRDDFGGRLRGAAEKDNSGLNLRQQAAIIRKSRNTQTLCRLLSHGRVAIGNARQDRLGRLGKNAHNQTTEVSCPDNRRAETFIIHSQASTFGG